MRVLAIVFFLLSLPSEALVPFMFIPGSSATDNVWTGAAGDGLWANAANWSQGHVPQKSEVAVFNSSCGSNCSASLVSTASIGDLRMESSFAGSITMSSSGNFNVTGRWDLLGGTFNAGTGTVNITRLYNQQGGIFNSSTGTINFNNYTNTFQGGTFNGSSGPVNIISGNMIFSGGTFTAPSSALTFTDGYFAIQAGAVFVANNGEVKIVKTTVGTLYLTDYALTQFYDLTFVAATSGLANFSIYTNLTATHNLTLDGQSGTSSMYSNGISVGNNIIVKDAGIVGTTIVTLVGSTHTVDASAATNGAIPGLFLPLSNATTTFSGNPIVTGDLRCSNGVTCTVNGAFSADRNLLIGGTFAGNSAITLAPTSAATLQDTSNTWPTGLLTYSGTSTMTQQDNVAAMSMEISSGTWLMGGKNLTVFGNLDVATGATLTKGGGTLSTGSTSGGGTIN